MNEKKALQAIDDAFDPDIIEGVLASLEARGARISRMEDVSSELTGMLGGAFARGDTFDTSFWTLYTGLDELAQQRVSEHFTAKVETVPAPLRKGFAKVFRK
ncbi:MAG: hypothetical protein WCC59_12325 [Terriglobales bacterium]